MSIKKLLKEKPVDLISKEEVLTLIQKEWKKAGKHEAPYLPFLLDKIMAVKEYPPPLEDGLY